jgi:hypothetical protein
MAFVPAKFFLQYETLPPKTTDFAGVCFPRNQHLTSLLSVRSSRSSSLVVGLCTRAHRVPCLGKPAFTRTACFQACLFSWVRLHGFADGIQKAREQSSPRSEISSRKLNVAICRFMFSISTRTAQLFTKTKQTA